MHFSLTLGVEYRWPNAMNPTMAKIIVHIGVHKTGTSALQKFMKDNAAHLSRLGYYYKPTSEAWPNHNPLAAAFRDENSTNGPDQLQRMINNAGEKTVIISSEILCEPVVDPAFFLSGIKDHEVRVIAYIRHPCDILISAFSEVVMTTRWTAPLLGPPLAYDPTQFGAIRRWLGSDITLAPYDPKQWVGGSIFTDFLAMLGINPTGFSFTADRENRRFAFRRVEMLRQINAGAFSDEEKKAVVAFFKNRENGLEDYPISPDACSEILNKMRLTLPRIEAYMRPGFDPAFLFEDRHATQ